MPKKKVSMQHLKLQLWKLAMADFSLSSVIEYLDVLDQQKPPPESALYHAMLSAISLEYARPFSSDSRSSLGSLSTNFEKFDTDDMKEMHEELLSARTNHYAHFSINHQDVLLAFRGAVESDRYVQHIRIGRADVHIAPMNLNRIRNLAVFQQQRFSAASIEMLRRTFDGSRVRPGVYRLILGDGIDLEPADTFTVSDKPEWVRM
jgi:hypothetical protein